MIRTSQSWLGILTSALLSLWLLILIYDPFHVVINLFIRLVGSAQEANFGLGLVVLYVTVGVIMLMMLLVFFKRTRPISFGLAIPLLVFFMQYCLFKVSSPRGYPSSVCPVVLHCSSSHLSIGPESAVPVGNSMPSGNPRRREIEVRFHF